MSSSQLRKDSNKSNTLIGNQYRTATLLDDLRGDINIQTADNISEIERLSLGGGPQLNKNSSHFINTMAIYQQQLGNRSQENLYENNYSNLNQSQEIAVNVAKPRHQKRPSTAINHSHTLVINAP